MAKRVTSVGIKSLVEKPSAAYLQALRFYWQGERESSLSCVADQLGEDAAKENNALYRLWIEILADSQDNSSLRILQKHINNNIDYKHPSWIPRLSLSAIIHYELGEKEGATILFRKLKRHSSNAYCKELEILLLADANQSKVLSKCQELVEISTDYFHLRRAAILAHRFEERDFQKTIARETFSQFGEHPLPLEMAFHESFGAKDYRKACLTAKKLRDAYPLHTEYQFYHAYCAYLIERTHLALREFVRLNRRFQEEDPDVLCLIGASLLSTNPETLTSAQKFKAQTYLQRAAEKLSSLGLSAAYPRQLLDRLLDKEVESSGRFWFVKLPPRQCFELYRRPLDRIEYLQRAMGEHVKKGDICLFISESQYPTDAESSQCRLVALYKAISNPEWHPLHRWQTSLKLQLRLEVGIPFAVRNQKLKERSTDGALKYGLCMIEGQDIADLERGIKSYTLDDVSFEAIFREWKQLSS